MSAHVWKAGDLAKCVLGGFMAGNPVGTFPRKGATYRVIKVIPPMEWAGDMYGAGLVLDRIRANNPHGGFYCGRFRPILPAEPAFTEAMRSLKPRVEA